MAKIVICPVLEKPVPTLGCVLLFPTLPCKEPNPHPTWVCLTSSVCLLLLTLRPKSVLKISIIKSTSLLYQLASPEILFGAKATNIIRLT